jgi:cytochrome subunit of sulfide dehydrogenase
MMLRILAGLAAVLLLVACGRDAPETPDAAPEAATPLEETAAMAEAAEEQVEDAVEQIAELLVEAPESTTLCSGCHGEVAPSPFSDMATIQGLPADAIENALYDFRAGTRPCRKSRCSSEGSCPDLDMCMVTADLDDGAIAELAQWYAGQRFVAADQAYDSELAAQGRRVHEDRCESCHTGGGVVAIDQANRLRGQHKEYLRLALDQYRSGERLAVGMMDSSVKALSVGEIDALLEFYASPVQ